MNNSTKLSDAQHFLANSNQRLATLRSNLLFASFLKTITFGLSSSVNNLYHYLSDEMCFEQLTNLELEVDIDEIKGYFV